MPNASKADDGRIARGVRTRESVITAFQELIADRGRAPTAADLARRADVSCRSIFTHFGDMDGVMSAAARRLLESLVDAYVPISQELPTDARIEAFLDHRVPSLEITAPFYRAVMGQGPPSKALSQLLSDAAKLTRASTSSAFETEIEGVAPETRADLEEAIIAVTTWLHWVALRSEQLLSVAQATAVIRLELRGLLRQAASLRDVGRNAG
jgi:TetR/AcrR family transcriptional regulator of autoinduction and epiphytic fitness